MRVYLVQHAEAVSKDEDPDRPLSDLGRQHAQGVAEVAAGLGAEVEQIRHSGKTRAEQTAKILGQALSPRHGVVAVSGLSPLDDVEPMAKEFDDTCTSVMLVGHLPFMERMAGQLLTGDAEQSVIDFINAGIVCLEKQEGVWKTIWILTPSIAEALR